MVVWNGSRPSLGVGAASHAPRPPSRRCGAGARLHEIDDFGLSRRARRVEADGVDEERYVLSRGSLPRTSWVLTWIVLQYLRVSTLKIMHRKKVLLKVIILGDSGVGKALVGVGFKA